MGRRVAITGMSVVSPIGIGSAANLSSLKEGKSGIAPITRFDASQFRSTIAGEVKNFDPGEVIDSKSRRMMDYFIQYTMVAAAEALKQSGLSSDGLSPIEESLQDRAGTIIGCGLGGLPEMEATHKILNDRGPSRISPFFIPKLISNLAPGHVGIRYQFRGPNIATASACTSGAHGIGEAFRMIKNGYMDIAVCGGTESTISPLCIGGFNAMRALSTRNEAPEKASRPFDMDRDGFVCAEGAGLLVIEEWEQAKKRGASILAEVVGYGATCDASHITAPEPEGRGARGAMELAIKEAGVSLEHITHVNAHGTSTPLGDIAETKAIKKVFGEHSKNLKISSTKSMTGHALGAAGGLEAVFTVMALQNQFVPPTINIENPDPECDLDYVANEAQDFKFDYAISNSFGFGGTNGTLLFKKV